MCLFVLLFVVVVVVVIIIIIIIIIIIVLIRLVSGSGDIKITKDGNVLLHEMVMY
jgi:hypothetical protein